MRSNSMRNGPIANARPPHRGSSSLLNALSRPGNAPATEAEMRLANDIAELMGRRPQSGGRPGGLTAALGSLQRNAIADAARTAERNAVFPSAGPPPLPTGASNPAYIMPGLAMAADADRAPVQVRPGNWIRKARRKRRLGVIRAAASWLTALAIGGSIVATSAVLLGAPRDLNGLVQLTKYLLKL